MRNLIAAAIAAAVTAGITSAVAAAEPQVGNGLGGNSGTNGNHSVLVQTVDGVTTVVVDGKTLTGDAAQPYIDAARARSERIRNNIDRWDR